MTKRTVVVRRRNHLAQPKTKRKSCCDFQVPAEKRNAGFARPVFVVVVCAALVALTYIYSINHVAVKGYQIRGIEKEIAELKEDNENLKIKEAQLKSLHRIEQSARDFNMSDLSDAAYIEENSEVAYESVSGSAK